MLTIIMKEFIAICAYLEKTGHEKRKGFFIVERGEMEKLLDKNMYIPAAEKLKKWKVLHWIDSDEGHLTKLVRVDGKPVRRIKICCSIAEELQILSEK